MASKRRVRRRECGEKKRHPTSGQAQAAAKSARRAGKVDGTVRAYRCPWCHQFHWGHVG